MNIFCLPRAVVPVLASFALVFAASAAPKPAPTRPPAPTPRPAPTPPDPTAPPANDQFAKRQVLPSATQLNVSGTTVNATQESFEAAYSQGISPGQGRNQTHTVWFSFTPAYSGTIHPAITGNDGHPIYFLLFSGGTVPSAATVLDEGYLPAGSGAGSVPADFTVTAGQEYEISLGATDFPGAFVLNLSQVSGKPSTSIPVVSVSPRGQADRATGKPGKFVLTLSEPSSTDLTLNYRLGGDAVPGSDYQLLTGSVNVSAGGTRAVVKIRPQAGTDAVSVKFRLQPGDGYTIGADRKAVLGISPVR